MPYTVRYTDGFLMHFGVGHLNGGHSGRYPWGSGEEGGERKRGLFGRKKSKSATPLTDEQKTEYLTKGNAKKVYEHRSEFTYQELDGFVKKLSKENDLKKLAYGEKKDKATMLKNTASIIGDIATIYTKYTEMQTAKQKFAKAESDAAKAHNEALKSKADTNYARLVTVNAANDKETPGGDSYLQGLGQGHPDSDGNKKKSKKGNK